MTSNCTIDKIKHVLSDLQSQLDEIAQSKKANVVENNEQPIEKPVEEKRQSTSLWGLIKEAVKKGFKVKKETSTYASESNEGSQGGSRKGKSNIRQDQEDANLEILKLQNDIRQMKAAFEKLDLFQSRISKSLDTEVPSNKLKAILSKTDSVKSQARDLKEIRRKVLNLKGQIPSLLKKHSSIGLSVSDSQTAEENGQIVETGSDIILPGLHVSYDFIHSSAFEEVVEKFDALSEFTDKLCLLSFAVFPECKEVERTMLMYWWIGEGFIISQGSEETVTKILDEFSRMGLLEPVEDERKLKPSGYKMEPHVHAAVIKLADRMELFKLYSEKKLTMQRSEKNNVCLVKRSSLQPEAKASKMPQIKDLNSVFNSSERYPDFTFKWFPGMEALKVLYLGRWERTAKRHIEVESTEFLKDMKSLKNLRLASFQGISRIENLKELNCSLPKLVILDLRACYNLEGLPKDIGSLVSLIYLDVSECYMLDRMPKEISRLTALQVLKGFVISQSDDEKDCAVKYLKNLRKLSITVNRYEFKVEDFMESLKDLQELESLKIAWGARFQNEGEKGEKTEETDETETQKQQGHATQEKHKDTKEREDDQVHLKGQTNEEKKDGNKKDNLEEEEKKSHEVNAERLESDKVVEGDKGNANKEEGKSKVAREGDKGKVTTEEGKKQDKVDAEKSRSEDGVEGVKKARPSSESTNKKTDDKQEEKGGGEKEKVNSEEGKKKDEVKKVSSKPDKVIEGDKKTSPPQESKDTSKLEDHQTGDKQEKKREEEKDKTEGEKKDEVKADNSEPEKVDKKTSPPQESKDTVKSKLEDHQTGDKQQEKREGDKTEGEKKDEVKADNSEPDKVDKKTSPPQESKDTVTSRPDDKQEEKRDEEKDKREEGKKKDEVKAMSAKPDKVLEGDKKTSPQQESKDTFQSKPDDDQRGEIQEEKREGEKDNIEEVKKKDDVNAENSKPGKVDKKTSPAQQSKDTIQSKPDDNKENSKVQDTGDGEKIKGALKKHEGEEANTQKLDKNKLNKKVSFSEEPKAPVQKKSATKESGSRIAGLFTRTKTEAKRGQEDSGTDTPKLPSSLTKLELECYPNKEPPVWLNPKTLDNLKKLSIKGGNLSRFSDKPTNAKNKCGVQILRLKYLHKFKAEWKDLQELFPQLKLLEKYKCPEVAFCPTDGNGVWRSQP
ncbi:unnamed protein product [Eruca vesicaria subsp. sativa]|uniref:Disease resistance R13L4/SHOC-2-like LRR domain-containing protein n=1 Tax=Eruca vesicaria subsp. sativa TaxID=29727 RepID=A0ABC8LZT6_ERUVS|nr:unnamed protein product [Eruca vesicaria subsp. sativa]